MKYKIGDVVSLIDNNSEKFVVAKSRFENLTLPVTAKICCVCSTNNEARVELNR